MLILILLLILILFLTLVRRLSVKTWRVYKIVSNSSLKRVKISNWDVLRRSLMLIGFALVYIIIVHAVAVPILKETVLTVGNQSTYHIACDFKYNQFETTLYVLEAVLLVYGASMCSATKDAPSGISIYIIIIYVINILILLLLFSYQ